MTNSNSILDKIKTILSQIVKQIVMIIGYFFTSITLQLIFRKHLQSSNLFLSNACYIFIELIILIIFIFLFKKTLIPDFYDFKKNGKSYIKNTYIYWLVALAIMIISNMIISSFIGLPTNEESNRIIIENLPIYSIVSVVFVGPIIEELLTRVILKEALKNKWIYIIASGLIFGFLHLLNIKTPLELFFIIPYGALGISFALTYYKTNNIWSCIFFHSLHNFISILLIFIGV